MASTGVKGIGAIGGAAMACWALAPLPSAGQSVEEFYKNNRLTIVVGYTAAGANNAYGRLLARHMGPHIPGNPSFIVQNMPGAGSLAAANHLYNIAARDGTVFGTFHPDMAINQKVEPSSQMRFDAPKFTWIGSTAKQTYVCLTWHTTGLKTVEDLQSREVLAATTGGPGGGSAVTPRALNHLLGTKFRLISGYAADEIALALERREVDARCGIGWATLKTTHPEWVKQQKIHIPIQFGLHPHPELPDVPNVMDFVKTVEERQALDVIIAPMEMGRPFAGPPGILGERANALRGAFDAAVKDPKLIEEADRAGLEMEPISGEQIDEILRNLYTNVTDQVFQRVASFRLPGEGEKSR